jgi:uroporphyrinogen decarboxylase
MKKLERVATALRGEEPDRPPYSFWTHLPGLDLEPERLAEATASFCARYDLDFVKTMPNGMYAVEDWGCVCDYHDVPQGGVARVVQPAITTIDDWNRLEPIDVTTGSYGRELDHFALVVKLVGPSIPVLATVFSPLTIAAKLSNTTSRAHLASDPEVVKRGLEVITEVTCAFAREAVTRGCAGVFLATQEATYGALDENTYRTFGEPCDRRVVEAASHAGAWFNVVHMHGDRVMFDLLSRYDVAALNWHIGETEPSVSDYRASGGTRPIVGGLRRNHLTHRNHAAVVCDIERAMVESRGMGILLAPACVIRHPVDDIALRFAADAIQGLASRWNHELPYYEDAGH